MLKEPRSHKDIPLWAHAKQEQWNDWKWQVSRRVSNLEQLKQVINITDDEERAIRDSEHLFRLGITPHYATLIDPDDPECPMRLQAVPKYSELEWAEYEMGDPLHEDVDSPVPGLTHRYPDRVLFLITHECSLYCRHCTRRRIVGDMQGMSNAQYDLVIDYIRRTPQIRDVLISGGDPLAVPDKRLEYVISNLRKIDHVEIIRIGSRMPVVMPQRVTQEFCDMLNKYHPIWFNTHFNHAFEVTHPDAKAAMERLANAGIPTGNQTVLLKKVNDCPVVMKKLMHELVKIRCRPYYLYNCDLSEGLSHFRTTVSKGIEIIEALRGHTSGYAVPQFVVDAPGGGGKIPVNPNYLLAQSGNKVVLRNFEGTIATYHEGTPDNNIQDGMCKVCHTDHSSINIGVAAQLSGAKKDAVSDAVPENVTRIGKEKTAGIDFDQPPIITVEQLQELEKGSGND